MSDETKEILNAVLHRLDALDANVAGVQNDVTSLKTEINQFRSETNQRFDHMDRQLRLFDSDTDMLNKKVAEHDRDINRLKQVNGI
ncbi:hypothetical protein HUG20_17120 [Salicibibacter cibi]|uniref:Uncharacterized protein n=1 Tax=Salicibibacter cibi TaxID=2743001 RepID=A0A7T6ZDV7_9BACI|nr:hypothetical protein [Salicibibacter cibi]QQK81462.1 hypothetical protein HUG20_17120 [Salicibibacter cibi]